MKKKILILAICLALIPALCIAQGGEELASGSFGIDANSVFGGSNNDSAKSIVQAENGDFIIAGWTQSFKVRTTDVFVQRIDSRGIAKWTKTFGKYGSDSAFIVRKAFGGGYFIGGTTTSFNKSNNNQIDNYLLKIDKDGNSVQESHTGKSSPDMTEAMRQTFDGGYIVAGNTGTSALGYGSMNIPPDVFLSNRTSSAPPSAPGYPYVTGSSRSQPGGTTRIVTTPSARKTYLLPEIYITRLDADGKIVWTEKCCKNHEEWAASIIQAKNDGFVIAGETRRFPTQGIDMLIAKLDTNGKELWEKSYGDRYDDSASWVEQTADGGFVVAGSYGGFTFAERNAVVLKLDSDGNKVWEKRFGGRDADTLSSVRQTKDLGFIAVGGTYSYGKGAGDVYVVKLRYNGDVEWERSYGGERDDAATDVIQTQDGGYAVLGYTNSFNKKSTDILLIRLDANGLEVPFDKVK